MILKHSKNIFDVIKYLRKEESFLCFNYKRDLYRLFYFCLIMII